ncbi:hypothetical protein IMCC3317_06410 [Kordia antarctica]|uniref:Uncharacterized protein n=1 Tax=Kordia antarctica TaxID=1218801 RepID=A0A7L4ZFC2_9FLAO|nr:hypothetical protein [Kordia antarctica]QHI35295.1 hypothetical protein IMCC3317_06410 [Kordia antarctica]
MRKKKIKKTEHCLLRQWERNIPDSLLSKAMSSINLDKDKKVIVTPLFFKRKNIEFTKNSCLILIIKEQKLITVYQKLFKNCLFKRDKNDYEILV